MCKVFVSNFLKISHAKNHLNRLIFDRVIQNKRWTFGGDTVYIIPTASSASSTFLLKFFK